MKREEGATKIKSIKETRERRGKRREARLGKGDRA